MRDSISTSTAITKKAVDDIKPGNRDRYLWDAEIKGFGLKVTPRGTKTFIFQYRFPPGRAGRVRRFTIGPYGPALTVPSARKQATTLRGQVFGVNAVDPAAAKAAALEAHQQERNRARNTFAAVAKDFIELHARPNNRSAAEYERILNVHVIPVWGTKSIDTIRRSDVAALLIGIVKGTNPGTKKLKRRNGAESPPARDGRVMAHYVLAVVRKLFHWHQTQSETFMSPVVKGMSPLQRPRERARKRTLSDDELRKVWRASEATPAPYGPLIRFLLLTAQRRQEATKAQWSEIDGNFWIIPAARYKTKVDIVVPLSAPARELLAELPRSGPYLFGARSRVPPQLEQSEERENDRPFTGFSKAKRKLDTASGVTGWTIHDLRRTARTLMSGAGVQRDIAERVLGHVIGGVAGIYDQWEYIDEKRHAVDLLAEKITQTLDAPPSSLRGGAPS